MGFRKDLDALIMGILEGEALHGYAIAQRIRVRNERVLRPGEGLVYPVLYRLAGDGVVTVGWQKQPDKPPRKIYSLRAKPWAGSPEQAQGDSAGARGTGDE